MISGQNWSSAGYANISTSDNIVHGQVKQYHNFAFARIYESGHEVPFYQPLAALEIFDRAIAGLDVESGKTSCFAGYKSVGTAESEYREGNATVQFDVLPTNATYNVLLNGPNPVRNVTIGEMKQRKRKRAFKPSFWKRR